MLVSAGAQLIPQKEYIKYMQNLFYSQDIYEQIAVPLKHTCDMNALSDGFPYLLFFKQLDRIYSKFKLSLAKSHSIFSMPVINQILLPHTNLKVIFYKACIVVFRNHIE